MEQPGNTARDDEPAPGREAEDAGSVVWGGHGIPVTGYVPSAGPDFRMSEWARLGLLSPDPAGAARITRNEWPADWDEGQTIPDALVHTAADLFGGVPAYTEAEVIRMYEQACVPVNEALADLGLSIGLAANEELTQSTRAEFPDDPYDYGRRYPHGPMRWTPPPEGEDTPPCPA